MNDELNLKLARDRYPRVTDILKKYHDFSFVKQKYLDQGTMVHNWIAHYLKGLYIPRPPEVENKILSLQKWLDIMVEKVILIEERLFNDKHGFTGKPDLVAMIRGENKPALIDYKSSVTVYKIYWGQLAAYKNLCGENSIDIGRSIILTASKQGKEAVIRETDFDFFPAFISALYAYKTFT